MDIIYILIPIGIVFLIGAIGAFIWAIKSGQYDDLDSPAHRILFDDESLKQVKSEKQSHHTHIDNHQEL